MAIIAAKPGENASYPNMIRWSGTNYRTFRKKDSLKPRLHLFFKVDPFHDLGLSSRGCPVQGFGRGLPRHPEHTSIRRSACANRCWNSRESFTPASKV